MIDEELYQFASDELNSDRRIPLLWNRACALARDDHDEARFLYKNLRVEELLEKKANGEPLPLGALGLKKSSSSTTSGDENSESLPGLVNDVSLDMDAFADAPDETLSASTDPSLNPALDSALNPTADSPNASKAIDASDTIDASINATDEAAGEKIDDLADDLADVQAGELTHARVDEQIDQLDANAEKPKVQLDPLVFPSRPLDDLEDSLDPSSSSQRAPSAMELGSTPAGYDSNVPKDALPSVDPEISSLAAQASQRVHQKNAGTADHPVMDQTSDAKDSANIFKEFEDEINADDSLLAGDSEPPLAAALNKDEELAFLDNSIEENRETIIDQQREVLHQKDALSEDLERQADTWLPKDAALGSAAAAGVALAAGAAHQSEFGTQSDQHNDQVPVLSNQQANATDNGQTNGPGHIDEILNPDKSLSDADLLSGPGKLYRVFSRGAEDNRAVPKGWSWAAMMVTFPWLLVKRMPATAIAYALLWIALLAGLAVTGINWIDSPAGADSTIAIWPLAFAALAFIGLLLIPLIMANNWHAQSLTRRGYEEIATVRAPDKTGAVDRIVQLAA